MGMFILLPFRTMDNAANCRLFPISGRGRFAETAHGEGTGAAGDELIEMADYRIYGIGVDGHIVKSMPLVCDDDRQAMESARTTFQDCVVELWSGERLVARLDPWKPK